MCFKIMEKEKTVGITEYQLFFSQYIIGVSGVSLLLFGSKAIDTLSLMLLTNYMKPS